MELEESIDTTENLKLEVSEYEGSLQPPNLELLGFHFRFTFSDQDKELACLEKSAFIKRCKLIHRSFITKLASTGYVDLGKLTSGFETRNKAGENCKAHIHVAFRSRHLKQSMNRTFQRYFRETWDQEYLGNPCYSFAPQHIRNMEEFWRYPIKQTLDKNLCRGFADEDLDNMHKVANECWHKACQINQARLDKKDTDDTLFLKVLSIIKKSDLPKNSRNIAKHFIQYYMEHNKPINNQVVKGYVNLALLQLKVMSIDDYIDLLQL